MLVFSKPNCPYCIQCKELLNSIGVTPTEKLISDVSASLKLELASMIGGSGAGSFTVPQVFIGGNCIRGFDSTQAAYDQGSLLGLLSAAGIEATPPSDLDVAQLLAARRALVPDHLQGTILGDAVCVCRVMGGMHVAW
jgi:glutaredoxin